MGKDNPPQGVPRVHRAPVTLRAVNGSRVFLPDHPIRILGRRVEALEYEGRNYVFSHRSLIGAFGLA